MVQALIKPGKDIKQSLSADKCHLLHMGIGINGEANELLECMDNEFESGEFDRVNAVEELGDLEFYIQGLPSIYKLNLANCDESLKDVRPDLDRMTLSIKIMIAAGNVLDAIKKITIYGKEPDKTNFRISLSRLIILMDWFYLQANISRSEALEANMSKLLTGDKARYKLGKYTDQQACDRADKKAG